VIGLGAIAPQLAFAADASGAADYPSKPVRLVVGLAPGGATDIMARALATRLSERLGRSFVVENRSGAGGTVAATFVSKAPPDGYTLLVVSASYSISAALYPSLQYDPLKDLAPISRLAESPFLLVAHPSLPVRNVKELIALARSRPGQINFASAGNGSSGHLTAELFKSMAGIPVTHIPYKGAGPALVDVLAGQVHYMFANILSSLPYVRQGRLKALGVTSARRSPVAPDIPTISEAGVKGYEVTSWYGVLAPAGTPAPILAKLNTEINRTMKSPEMHDWLSHDGASAVAETPDQFAKYIAHEIGRWRKVVKEAHVQVQ
jgi:tripartite-type tricarboxylate transporter receptor subunit TctC